MALLQTDRAIGLHSPLPDDVLLFRKMVGTESLSGLFKAEIDLLSEDGSIQLDEVLGQTMAVRLDMPESSQPRYFHGYVSEFGYAGTLGQLAAYRATLRPWFWLLTRTTDCRIFQEMTIPEIIKQVFEDRGFSDFEDFLADSYLPRDYCVQYRESDFNFVSRLMEEEGMYYYFKHEKDKHTLVLADSYSGHEVVGGYEQIPYFPPDEHGRRQRDHIVDWSVDQKLQPGIYALNDFDFKAPKKNLHTTSAITREHAQADYEIYDYPGNYLEPGDGENYARIRIEELQAQYQVGQGKGDARGLAAGALFSLTGYPRDEHNKEYLVVSARHELQTNRYETELAAGSEEERYECRFTAIDAGEPYRSPRLTRRPTVQGPQTAIVVGKSGEEIWTDKYGRVKVQFHWDRYGKHDENSSCWVRVSYPWAGKGWGAISIPRIGQEVIVDFLEGDPDRPMITGRVYNADAMPPYGLPAGGVTSGIKTNSTIGGGGYNEMAMDDTKGKEKITIHAQYDMDTTVEHDQSSTVHNHRTDTVDVDDSETIGNNQTLSVGVDQTVTVGSNQSTTVGANRTVDVGANQETGVGASRTVQVTAADSLKALTITTEASTSQSLKAGATFVVEAGATVTINAGAMLTLQVGGSSITMTPASIMLASPMIKLN